MTYLHKLAKRLASLPFAVGSTVVLLSCSQGEVQDYLGPAPNSKTLVGLSISPRDPQVAVGDSVRLEATGYYADGKSGPVAATWSASGGSVSSSGWFRPSEIGEFRVRAAASAKPSLSDSVRVAAFSLTGGISRLEVLPGVSALPKGTSQQFYAQATLSDGTVVQPTVSWASSSGTITSSGLFTATGGEGPVTIFASLGTLASAQAQLVVQPPLLTQILLNPGSVVMESGETRALNVAASWSDGSSALPGLLWTVEGGTLSQGQYTAGGAPGTYRIIVASPAFGRADTTVVTILPQLVDLVLEPDHVILAPGASQPLSAFVLRNDGSRSPAGVQWTATGGTVAQNGTYTAGQDQGEYRVIVTLQSLSGQLFADTTQFEVVNGSATLIRLSVTPGVATIPAGDRLQFVTSGTWSDGSSTVPAVDWTATAGTVDPTGLFTAPETLGAIRVIGRQRNGNKADTATVTVVPKLRHFRISPKVDTIVTGSSRQFSATLSWSDGDSHPVTIDWQTSGGAISPTGEYTPGALVGSFLVIAACSCGAVDTASVTVRSSERPTLMSLVLSPHSLALALGGVQQFYTSGIWSDNSSEPIPVVYQATGGTISPTGYYNAGTTPGTYRVIARHEASGRADTAVVSIISVAVLNQVVLNPASVTVAPGATQDFSVAGVWSDGGSAAPPVSYSATGGTITSEGRFTAGTETGEFRVIATWLNGPLADTSVVVIGTPGSGPTLTQLVLTPGTGTVLPGASQLFSVAAQWSDGSTTLPPLAWSATGGTISAGGSYTAGGTAGSYQVIVRHQGGTKVDTSTVTIPALTALSLSPDTVSVGAGGAQVFAVTGTWSSGTGAPKVTFVATGGTVSPTGLFTAGGTTGTYRVIAQFAYGTLADTAMVQVTTAVPPPPAGDLVVFPDPSIAFIVGPQLSATSALNPWPWYTPTQLTRGKVHGSAFPADPTADSDHNVYLLRDYYDLALTLWTAFYRSGDTLFRTYARKVADSRWLDVPRQGTNLSNWDNTYPPRHSSLSGLMLRALDGRPEFWPWITAFVRAKYDTWLGLRLNSPQLHYGVREGAFMLLYAAQLAAAHPDPGVRAEFRQKALDAAKLYYARLQDPDGGWYWIDVDADNWPKDAFGNKVLASQPFQVGLLVEGLIATHKLTGDAVVAAMIPRAADWLWAKSYQRQPVTNLSGVSWRAMRYFTLTPNFTSNDFTTAFMYGSADGGMRDARQANATPVHAFGYAYCLTRDSKYQGFGDEVFAATFGKGLGPLADRYSGLADFREKEYNQSYRSSGWYLVWRTGAC